MAPEAFKAVAHALFPKEKEETFDFLYGAYVYAVGGFKTLAEGQKVSYDTEPDPKDAGKLRAVNVRPL